MPERLHHGARRLVHLARQARLMPRRVDLAEQHGRELLARVDGLAARLDEPRAAPPPPAPAVDDALGRAAVLAAADAPARDTALAALLERLGPAPALAPGLSVLVHATGGDDAAGTARAALRLLDALGADGEVLVLDDASADATADALAAVAETDARLRVVGSDRLLGPVRARAASAHAARFEQALVLDAGARPDAAGVRELLAAAGAADAALAFGPVVVDDGAGRPARVAGAAAAAGDTAPEGITLRATARARALGARAGDPLADLAEHAAAAGRLAARDEVVVWSPVVTGTLAAPAADELVAAPTRARLGGAGATCAAARRPRAAAPPAGPRVLVASSAGVANLGDDMILLAALDRLRALLGPAAELVVASDGPAVPEVGREAAWACTLAELAAALEPAEEGAPPDLVGLDEVALCVLVGGGTLERSFASQVRPRGALARACARGRIPLVVTGQGIGRLDAPEEEVVRALAGVATAFTVRDAASARTLAALGREASVHLDDAVGLAPAAPAAVRAALVAAGLAADAPYVGVTLRAADYAAGVEVVERWAAAVDAWAGARGLPVALVPMARTPAPDELGAGLGLAVRPGRTARWVVADPGADARLAAGLLAGARAVAAASFHGGLMAAAAGVPAAFLAAGPYQDGKCRGAAAALGLPETVVVPGDGGEEALAAALAAPPTAPGRVLALAAARDAALAAAVLPALPLPAGEFGENGQSQSAMNRRHEWRTA